MISDSGNSPTIEDTSDHHLKEQRQDGNPRKVTSRIKPSPRKQDAGTANANAKQPTRRSSVRSSRKKHANPSSPNRPEDDGRTKTRSPKLADQSKDRSRSSDQRKEKQQTEHGGRQELIWTIERDTETTSEDPKHPGTLRIMRLPSTTQKDNTSSTEPSNLTEGSTKTSKQVPARSSHGKPVKNRSARTSLAEKQIQSTLQITKATDLQLTRKVLYSSS